LPREPAHIFGTARPVTPKAFETMSNVEVVAANASLDEDGRKLCRFTRAALLACVEHHSGEARRERQRSKPAAFNRDAAVAIKRTDLL
jgi:GTP-dependent phosphoenolpyruvate carboxykinase